MKSAIDRFVNDSYGKEMEVAASDIYSQYRNRDIPRKHARFYCPECHETVFFRRKGSGEFYHQTKTDFSPECDKRVDGNSDLYIYERTGLPIYLTKSYGTTYNINIAFPALGEQKLQQAFSDKVTLTINNKLTIPITPSRFYADETTLIPIDFVPLNSKNYIIDIKGVGSNLIQKKWSNYADGFHSAGAIFSIHNNFGKKIKRGNSIVIKNEYYLVSKDFNPPFPEIHFKKIGNINLNSNNFNVYIFSVNVSVDSHRFNNINNYFSSRFKVWLIEKCATISPIWPPAIDRGEHILCSNNSVVFCNVESGNDIPKVFSYSGKDSRQIPVDIDHHNNKTIKLGVHIYEPTIASVDTKYTGQEICIRKAPILSPSSSINIAISSKSNDIIDTSNAVDYHHVSNGIVVTSNTKFTMVLKASTQVFKPIHIVKPETTLDEFKGLSKVFLAYGSSQYGYVIFDSFNIVNTSQTIHIDEQQLISNVIKNSRGALIPAPLWIKDLFHLCDANKLMFLKETLKISLKNGKTYAPLISYLSHLRRILTYEQS